MKFNQKVLLFIFVLMSNISQTTANTEPTFDVSDGTLLTKVDPDGGSGIGDITILSDGKIVAVGGVRDYAHHTDTCVVRYNKDGSIDTSFADDGIVITDIAEMGFKPENDWTRDSVIQPDGKIIVVGYTQVVTVNSISHGFQIKVTRYNEDGSLDTSFSDDGYTRFALGGDGHLGASSVALQPDGKIIVAGQGKYRNSSPIQGALLIRYNSDGTLDTSFAGNGYVIDSGLARFINDVALQVDGKILVTGKYSLGEQGSSGYAEISILARYNNDGSLDTSFANNGVAETKIGSLNSGKSIAIQQDGKILIGGNARIEGSFDNFSLTRYNADGSLDMTFSGDGYVTTDFHNAYDYLNEIVIQPDGKILATGRSGKDFGLARYNPDGELDSTFGLDGVVTFDFYGGPLADDSRAIAIQSDGKIITAGSAFFPVDDRSGVHNFMAMARYNTNGSLDLTFNKINRLGQAVNYTENRVSVYLDREVKVYDEELNSIDNYEGASVTLSRHNGENLDDVFSSGGNLSALKEGNLLVLSGEIVGGINQNSDGNLTLSFNSNATQAIVNETLSSIKYANSSDLPDESIQIDWTFSDGNQGDGGELSTTGFTIVNITQVNDKPTANNNTVATGSTKSYIFNVSDFGYHDAEDGENLSEVNITRLPSSGLLKFDGFNLIQNIDISGQDIKSGKLSYSPESGVDKSSFKFKVKDSDGEYSSSTYTIILDSVSNYWYAGSWGECTGPCGTSNGTKSREVYCKSSTGEQVSDINCTEPKPATSEPCTASMCSVEDITPPVFTVAPVNKTVETTGLLTQVELGNVLATDDISASVTISNDAPVSGFELGATTVTWSATDMAGNIATATQVITVKDSTTYTWYAGSWGACTGLCGTDNGTKSREVYCKSSTGEQVSDINCTAPKLTSSEPCTASMCSITGSSPQLLDQASDGDGVGFAIAGKYEYVGQGVTTGITGHLTAVEIGAYAIADDEDLLWDLEIIRTENGISTGEVLASEVINLSHIDQREASLYFRVEFSNPAFFNVGDTFSITLHPRGNNFGGFGAGFWDGTTGTPYQGGSPFVGADVSSLTTSGYAEYDLNFKTFVEPTSSEEGVSQSNIINISTRANVGGGQNDVYAGFVVYGTEPKRLIIRGLSVKNNVNPTIRLLEHFSKDEIGKNDDWQDSENSKDILALPSHLQLRNKTDAGLLLDLKPGVYDVVLSSGGSPGLGVVSIDEIPVTDASQSNIINISTRANISGGQNDVYAGFVIEGTTPKRVILRGLSVSDGVDPTIRLLNHTSKEEVGQNDDWESSENADEILSLPKNLQLRKTTDAALLLDLKPGVYDVVLSSMEATGLGVVSIDEVPVE